METESPSSRLCVNGDTDESWTDAESLSSSMRANQQAANLRSIVHELEVIKANVQIMLDKVLAALEQRHV